MTNQEFHKEVCKASIPYYPSDDDLSGTTLLDSQDIIIRNIKGQCEFVQCLSTSDDFTDGIKESLIYSFLESIVTQANIMLVINDKMHKQTTNLIKRPAS